LSHPDSTNGSHESGRSIWMGCFLGTGLGVPGLPYRFAFDTITGKRMTSAPNNEKKTWMKRVVVSGSAGFLGSHLCERLHGMGVEVIGVDNLLTGHMENLSSLIGKEGFTFLHHNVVNYLHISGEVDAVLHFASAASPPDYMDHPIQTLKVGAHGTVNMLGVAKAKGARFLMASTSEVYGDPQISPQPEEYWGHVNPIGVRSVYDEAKRYAEAACMAYHRTHGLDVRIARIFNCYGPRLRRDGRVVPAFLHQALMGNNITVFGDGTQTRSFCYVDDLIDGLLGFLHCDYVGPVNVGNPEEYTVLELAKIIVELTDSVSEVVYRDLPADDPKQRCPDISKAKSLFGWEPNVDLRDGLTTTLQWFRAEFGRELSELDQRVALQRKGQ